MQIKATLRYHFASTRVAKIHMTDNTSVEVQANRTLIYSWWICKMIKPPLKMISLFFIKLNMHLVYDARIPLKNVYSRKANICFCVYFKDYMQTFIKTFFITQNWKTGNNLKVYQQEKEFLNYDMFTKWNTI